MKTISFAYVCCFASLVCLTCATNNWTTIRARWMQSLSSLLSDREIAQARARSLEGFKASGLSFPCVVCSMPFIKWSPLFDDNETHKQPQRARAQEMRIDMSSCCRCWTNAWKEQKSNMKQSFFRIILSPTSFIAFISLNLIKNDRERERGHFQWLRWSQSTSSKQCICLGGGWLVGWWVDLWIGHQTPTKQGWSSNGRPSFMMNVVKHASPLTGHTRVQVTNSCFRDFLWS